MKVGYKKKTVKVKPKKVSVKRATPKHKLKIKRSTYA